MSMRITAIPLDKVEYDPDQPRKNRPQADVNALVNSIALKGLLNPIHARYALPFSFSIFGSLQYIARNFKPYIFTDITTSVKQSLSPYTG